MQRRQETEGRRQESRVRPFSNGAQFMDWLDKNCSLCRTYSWANAPLDLNQVCPVELALVNAAHGDGTVSRMVAEHMNYLRPDGSDAALEYCWPCGDIQPTTDEHAATVRAWFARAAAESTEVAR